MAAQACTGRRRWVIVLAAAMLSCLAGSGQGAGLIEREVVFSEAEVQAALDRASPVERSIRGLMTVTLRAPPQVSLERDDSRAGIAAQLDIAFAGSVPIPVDIAGNSGIRYDDASKAFYLERPVIDFLRSPALSSELAPAAGRAVSHLLSAYFRTRPIHVLRTDGSAEERAAHWLLRSLRIERGRVIAVLAPF